MRNRPTLSEIASTAHLSTRQAAKELGYSSSTISKYRRKHSTPPGTSSGSGGITDPSGTIEVEGVATTVSEAEDVLRSKGIDPDEYNITYGFAEWESGDKTLKSSRIRAVPKPVSSQTTHMPDIEELLEQASKSVIAAPMPHPTKTVRVYSPADLQIGKTDSGGGTKETIERVNESLARIVRWHESVGVRCDKIILADVGDIVENFYNTSSQRETNDLDITSQIRVARRLLLNIIETLMPYCNELIYVSVPSNHGTVRVGFQAEAATVDNDWGLAIQEQIMDVYEHNPDKYSKVRFVRPDSLEDSVSVYTDFGIIGFAHGHQASNPDKIGDWWKGQSHGRGPVANADILVVGHWHSFRVQHSGNARWIMVAPTSDAGSSWFTRKTGEYSQTGILGFTLTGGAGHVDWADLEIF